jgi:hypothetical protein
MYRLSFFLGCAVASLGLVAVAAAQEVAPSSCTEMPREDALPSLCAPPTAEATAAAAPSMLVRLTVPEGTPLRIAIDQRVRVSHTGEAIHGKVVESVYAFDQPVIPAGSTVSGSIVRIEPVSGKTRILSYTSGNFTPFHKYQVTFDTLTLPGGRRYGIHTTVSPGSSEVVHLVANQTKAREEKKKSAAARAVNNAKQEAKTRVHETVSEIKSPDLLHRLKELVLAQSPYHREYLKPGTRFSAALNEPMDFGRTTRTQEQLSQLGGEPAADSLLHARLVSEVSSANAKRGTGVTAVLTEPVYSPDHHLLLPANSRLVGEVLQATPARRLHHNGDLRIAFNRIETPAGAIQSMQGSLAGVEVDRAANLKLDEEGGAHATDSKTRYLSTSLSILMAAAASHPDTEHGTTDAAGDPTVRAGAGGSGSRFAGSLIALAARSQPVSLAFGAYGASMSVYSNFLSRGRDVVFAKDTPIEIDFGLPHTEAGPAPRAKKTASRNVTPRI